MDPVAWTRTALFQSVSDRLPAERYRVPVRDGATLLGMLSAVPGREMRVSGEVNGTALEPFPPVEKLRPGLWSVPVPIPNNPLRYVLVYVFETPRGAVLIDAGWNTDESWQALVTGLGEAGFRPDEVRGVLVTHIHPDHYGLAGRVRAASGAWVALHPADADLIGARYVEPTDLLARVAEWLERMGAPAEEIELLKSSAMPVRPYVDVQVPDVLLEDGDRPEVEGWDLTAIWTPGHSPGHLCFYEATHRLMLSGDHVLPRITPNIPFHPQSRRDPLGDYLRSLEKVADWDCDEVLPAHEYRFADLRRRTRELREHHEARFTEALAAVRDGEDTGWAVAQRMTWSRPWSDLHGFHRRAALGEALAHLRVLVDRGDLRQLPGEPVRYATT